MLLFSHSPYLEVNRDASSYETKEKKFGDNDKIMIVVVMMIMMSEKVDVCPKREG